MALTVSTIEDTHVTGVSEKTLRLDVTFDNSYPTGGETLDTSGYNITTIMEESYKGDAAADAGYTIQLVGTRANGGITAATDTKLVVYAGASQVADTTDLSALRVTATFRGK
jgi:hypothetical protein